MNSKTDISLYVPNATKQGRYFSFRLKPTLKAEKDEYRSSKSIFVVSDIEGNFRAFCRLLIKGKVMDKHMKWTFEDNHLVIVGDCFDKGEQVTECLWLIYSLEEKAKLQGGYVHFILGNHEIMNLNGDWRYVHPKYAQKSSFTKTPSTALYDANNEIWRWLQTKNIIERIGDILFVHGGISPELLQLNLSISEINSLARSFYCQANEPFSDPVLYTIFNSDKSPIWYRGYYQQTTSEEQINAVLKHFKVQTIITGHTVVDQITSFFNGKLINVDTDHTSEKSAALFISRNRFYRLNRNGERERIITYQKGDRL